MSISVQGVQQIGTRRQHNYCIHLAEKAGYEDLRYAVCECFDSVTLSNVSRTQYTQADVDQLIRFLGGDS